MKMRRSESFTLELLSESLQGQYGQLELFQCAYWHLSIVIKQTLTQGVLDICVSPYTTLNSNISCGNL